MNRYLLHKVGKVLKSLFIVSVLLYIAMFLFINPIPTGKNQYFDIRTAILISLGFAGSFRAMLCCRKKV